MKKKNVLCMALAFLLAVQSFAFTALATEATEAPTEAPTEVVTEAPTEAPTEPPTEAPTVNMAEVPYGETPITYGCRTLDAQIPLGGSDKLLKTAKGVFVYETNSDTVFYSYNPDQRLAPGGLVQVVSALTVIAHAKLDDIVTVSTRYINELPWGVRHVSLQNGEEVTVRELLYCMLVASANDAAVVLAEHVGGTPDKFIEMMNAYVKELGCENTVLTTVSGLEAAGQYTTARDMARILDKAMEYEEFRNIIGSGLYYMEATNLSDARELKSMNYFLEDTAVSKFYDSRVTGGKVSYTSADVGASIAFTAETEELSLVCVIMGATRNFMADGRSVARYGNLEEAEDLMDHCFGKYHVRRLLYRDQAMTQLTVEGGMNDLVVKNTSSLDIVLPTNTGLDDLRLEYNVPTLQAPIQENEEVGSLRLWYGQSCVGETKLYAMSSVASTDQPGFSIQSGASRTDADLAQLMTFLAISLLCVLALLALYLMINSIRKSIARKKARKLRRQQREARMQTRRTRR